MSEIIITQDKNIIKYINELIPPYFSTLQNHIVNMIILDEGDKSL